MNKRRKKKKQKKQNKGMWFLSVLILVIALGCLVMLWVAGDGNSENKDGKEIETVDKSRVVNEIVETEPQQSEVQQKDQNTEGETVDLGEVNETDPEVTMVFGGDICFHDEYSNMYQLSARGGDISGCFSPDLFTVMQEADVFMVNNEFTYTTRGEPTPDKAYTLRSRPENVQLLKDMGVDIVSLANNHTYDYGEISLLDTLDTLQNASVLYAGAGRNLEEASAPVYVEHDGMTIAFVAATQIERLDNPDTKGATGSSAGVFRCWDVEPLLQTVKVASQNSDFVVVYIHWGTESTDVTDWAQTSQAPRIAQAGADLIVGDHPHVLQGIDVVEGAPVVYSVGNLWFNSKAMDSCLIQVTAGRDEIRKLRYIPARQENATTSMLMGSEKARVLSYIQSLSPNVAIDGDGVITD